MFCPRCGAESPADVRYCYSCGADMPRRTDDDLPGADDGLRGRAARRLQRLVGHTRRERVVSALIAALMVIAVIGFLSLDPPEDEQLTAARDSLDADCVAAKGQVIEAMEVLVEPGGAERYALRVVVAMMDLRDSAAASGLNGADRLRAAALDAAAAAGRAGRLSREEAPTAELEAAAQQRADAWERLIPPARDLGLDDCANTVIDEVR